MSQLISLQHVNNFNQTDFIKALGGIFEHSPWVAEQVFTLRPFDSIQQLHQLMFKTVNNADKNQRKALICNHPELAGKEAQAGELTIDSNNEQAAAGLNNCSAQELEKLRHLNQQYYKKFDFPFIIAVKNLTRYDILHAIEARLKNTIETEFDSCIEQIGHIAEFRLKQLITH